MKAIIKTAAFALILIGCVSLALHSINQTKQTKQPRIEPAGQGCPLETIGECK